MQTKRESDYFLTPIWKWPLASETEFAPHKSLKFSEILHSWCLILSLKSVQVISLNSIQVQRIWANDNGNISLYWGPEHLQGWDSDALRSCTTLDCRGTALPRSSFLIHKTRVSAAAMLLEPLWVALEGFLWGAQKHFITCVYLCVCTCVHGYMQVPACMSSHLPWRWTPVCSKHTSKKFRFKVGVYLDFKPLRWKQRRQAGCVGSVYRHRLGMNLVLSFLAIKEIPLDYVMTLTP